MIHDEKARIECQYQSSPQVKIIIVILLLLYYYLLLQFFNVFCVTRWENTTVQHKTDFLARYRTRGNTTWQTD